MIIIRSPIVSKNFRKASNFVNAIGEHPKIFSVITWDKIVLEKESFKNNNWLYVGCDPIDISKKQLNTLKFYNDWIVILEK